LETAIAQTDRLEATIDELLALARDTHAVSAPLDLDALFAAVREQWHGPLAVAGRPLRLARDADVQPVRASTIAVRQIIDVLVGNAVEHGAGAITLRARRVGDGVAIDVSDEGAGIVGDPAEVFRRRSGDEPGRGIGLALARSLAEAEGGRLVLSRAGAQPVFTLVFASASSSHARSAGSGDAPV
jgi:signal transduction histidine kinase